jgi:hypothetical protein
VRLMPLVDLNSIYMLLPALPMHQFGCDTPNSGRG